MTLPRRVAPLSTVSPGAGNHTRLGQRRCYSLTELIEMNLKVGIVREPGIETLGWISTDSQRIMSPGGAVWIQLNGDVVDREGSASVGDASEDDSRSPEGA